MAYATNSITNANPGATLYAVFASLLTTAGFTQVDTLTISTRTHYVWKSAAANNTAGLDWYLDIGYLTTGAGAFTLQCFEFYDPATDLGYRGLYSGAANTTIDATTFSRYGATGYALETNWMGATTFTAFPTTLPATAFTYWLSITGNRVMLMTTVDNQALHYVGMYDPDPLYASKAGANLYPLVGLKTSPSLAVATATASSRGALTRVPPVTTLNGNGWGIHLAQAPAAASALVTPIPAGPTTAYPYVATPVRLYNSTALNASFGNLYDAAVMASSTTIGNTVTMNGATWVLAASDASQSFLMKAV